MINPPEFVYADVHGNLKVKMSHEVRGRAFFKFNSITELAKIIEKNNAYGKNDPYVISDIHYDFA